MVPSRWCAAFLLGLGLVLALFAFSSWTSGNPPPATLFAPRETVRVAAVEVLSGRTNGSIRYRPRVTVLWRGEVMELAGLVGSFYDYRRASAEAAITGYAVGEAVTVKLVNAVPYADRTDWFTMLGAVWMSLFAVAIMAAAGVLALASNAARQS